MRIPGLGKLRRAGAYVRNQLEPNVLVLMYHRVADPVSDPWDIAVRPDRFAEHMAILARRGRVMTLAEVREGLDAGRLERAIAITFDDGYLDTLQRAAPVLECHSLPATVFTTTRGLMTGGARMWWDPLGAALLHDSALPPRLELGEGAGRFAWDVPPPPAAPLRRWRAEPVDRKDRGTPPPRARLYLDVYRYLAAREDDDRAARVEELVAWARAAGVEPHVDDAARTMTADELRSLAAREGITIGSHTATHPFLSQVDETRRRREIEGSRRALEEVVERPVLDFSFPNGDTPAGAPALLRDAGYRTGCTSRSAAVRASADPYLLPRLIVRDWDGRRFSRWLSRWGHG